MELLIKKGYVFIIIFPYLLFAQQRCDTLNTNTEKVVVCTTYYRDGTIERISSRLNGKRHGINKSFHKNGQVERSGNYKYGKLIDTAIGYFSSGKLKSITSPYGDIIFFENGDTMAIGHKKDGHQIKMRRIYYEGYKPKRFITYNDSGKKHGWEVNWYKNGNLEDSIRYENGTMVYYRANYTNGNLRLRVKEYFKDTFKRKEAAYYYRSGERCGEIKNGNGTVIIWADDASVGRIKTYKNGEEVASRKLAPGEKPSLSEP